MSAKKLTRILLFQRTLNRGAKLNLLPARLDGINLLSVAAGAVVATTVVAFTLTAALMQQAADSLGEG